MRERVPARNEWGERIGYSRAVRAGDLIEVAGTTASGGSAYEQARAALATIADALRELGASLEDVVRTRMFVVDIDRNADAERLAARAEVALRGNWVLLDGVAA